MSGETLRRDTLKTVKSIVIKIGSGVLTSGEVGLNSSIFKGLAREISLLKKNGYHPIIVSSGAIAAGMQKLGLCERPKNIPQKQAAAAVGQSTLMWNYERSFAEYNQKVAQVLLTHDDLSNRQRYLNARNTLLTLSDYGIIPIINENDSVAVEEIKFGDNDNLSAMTTNLVGADLLIILTDIDGLYDKDPCHKEDAQLIPLVKEIDDEIEKIAGDTTNQISIGGMITKVQAAKKAAIFGVPTIVANGKLDGIINKIITGEEVGTLFLPKKTRMNSRKHWIAFTLKTKGEICVDDGAKKAIVDKGKSLLPSGVLSIKGKFGAGDSVTLVGPDNLEFAKGLVNYSSSEITKIKGLKTVEIEAKLGYKYFDEIIHRDDLVVFESCK
ncbi:MAG: glutamate 5-kinase [Pseudomonadota bacterium]